MAKRRKTKTTKIPAVPGVEIEMFEEIFPDDPRYAQFGTSETRRTLDAAWESGALHPDCPLCRMMLEHQGPSILTKVHRDN